MAVQHWCGIFITRNSFKITPRNWNNLASRKSLWFLITYFESELSCVPVWGNFWTFGISKSNICDTDFNQIRTWSRFHSDKSVRKERSVGLKIRKIFSSKNFLVHLLKSWRKSKVPIKQKKVRLSWILPRKKAKQRQIFSRASRQSSASCSRDFKRCQTMKRAF